MITLALLVLLACMACAAIQWRRGTRDAGVLLALLFALFLIAGVGLALSKGSPT